MIIHLLGIRHCHCQLDAAGQEVASLRSFICGYYRREEVHVYDRPFLGSFFLLDIQSVLSSHDYNLSFILAISRCCILGGR